MPIIDHISKVVAPNSSGVGDNDTMTLICDGTNWFEIARSVN